MMRLLVGHLHPVLLQVLRVQLSLGDIAAAQRSLGHAEAAAASCGAQERWAALLAADRALVLFAQQDFAGRP